MVGGLGTERALITKFTYFLLQGIKLSFQTGEGGEGGDSSNILPAIWMFHVRGYRGPTTPGLDREAKQNLGDEKLDQLLELKAITTKFETKLNMELKMVKLERPLVNPLADSWYHVSQLRPPGTRGGTRGHLGHIDLLIDLAQLCAAADSSLKNHSRENVFAKTQVS
jgi:hypothetical protein